MLDLHSHILHGVDDGSFDIEDSLKMARLAVEGGTTVIVATPHSNCDDYPNYLNADLKNRFTELKSRISDEGIPLKLCMGQEILAQGNFISMIKNGILLTVNNSGYPLIEFDFYEQADSVFSKAEQLIAEGYTPIIAHPERYAFINENIDFAYRLKSVGCCLQINKGSIKGGFGREIYKTAHKLLKNSLADFVASDAHGPYVRTPYLADAYEIISEMYSEDYAKLLLDVNPLKALKGEKL